MPRADWTTLLWDTTAYPCEDPEEIVAQIKDMAERSGCDLEKARDISYDELDAATLEPINEVAKPMGGES